jgi:hypothetical protein
MKPSLTKVFSICSLILACSTATLASQNNNATIRLSEPVLQDANSETFGAPLDSSIAKVSLKALITKPEAHVGKPIQLETKITKVCQKKGCFFIAQYEEKVLRVSFKDYGFFIPTDAGGKTVLLAGELIKKEMSPEQAEHFKQDLQTESDSIKAGVVYEIVATSVKVPISA